MCKECINFQRKKEQQRLFKIFKKSFTHQNLSQKNCSLCKNYKGDVKLLSSVLSVYSWMISALVFNFINSKDSVNTQYEETYQRTLFIFNSYILSRIYWYVQVKIQKKTSWQMLCNQRDGCL